MLLGQVALASTTLRDRNCSADLNLLEIWSYGTVFWVVSKLFLVNVCKGTLKC